jgi:hypothetical protein
LFSGVFHEFYEAEMMYWIILQKKCSANGGPLLLFGETLLLVGGPLLLFGEILLLVGGPLLLFGEILLLVGGP